MEGFDLCICTYIYIYISIDICIHINIYIYIENVDALLDTDAPVQTVRLKSQTPSGASNTVELIPTLGTLSLPKRACSGPDPRKASSPFPPNTQPDRTTH